VTFARIMEQETFIVNKAGAHSVRYNTLHV